jgi:hypothetical protein
MAEITQKDIFDTLTESYGKVIAPEFRAIRTKLDEHDQKFGDIAKHFYQIYQRFGRLDNLREKFSFAQVINSAEYVRKLREQEGKKFKSGKEFIEELIKWQKSES